LLRLGSFREKYDIQVFVLQYPSRASPIGQSPVIIGSVGYILIFAERGLSKESVALKAEIACFRQSSAIIRKKMHIGSPTRNTTFYFKYVFVNKSFIEWY